MKKIDMHVHTTASDGSLNPKEIIHYAKAKGLYGIGITDHDTIEGIEEAKEYGKKEGVLVIPGIELSTEDQEDEIHILGYNIDFHAEELINLLYTLKFERKNRAIKIIQKLRNLHIDISPEEVMDPSKEGVIGRPHIAKVLAEKGYVEDIPSAFHKYLNKGEAAYVPRFKITPFEAIHLIKKIGGISVIAHPGIIKDKSIILKLIKAGIEGIEVYHSLHTTADENYLYGLTQEFNLIVTGGSDFHYPYKNPEGKGDLGSHYSIYEDIKDSFNL
ncbi:PHP domain-containing protein [Alkaliphilus serpentinus]|uniref:PHP domain-containing protein n=1 Tax=Alkaliphilus serpentinus TaxID=1482731 RepID=A0A833HLY8_9FIRM|nr:PHP domain-containing protein [Alkaliphilus serpentinus]KAB3526748.1 PHP domain-containing protein [Alkaliphilus serpentinus]